MERSLAEQLLTLAEATREVRAEVERSAWCTYPSDEGDDADRYECNGEDCLKCYLLRMIDSALAPLLEDSKGPTQAGANPHDYLSTACFHGLHKRCRRHCKFCGVDCRCTCHVKAQPAAPGRSQVEASAPGASQWLEGPQNDPGASG